MNELYVTFHKKSSQYSEQNCKNKTRARPPSPPAKVKSEYENQIAICWTIDKQTDIIFQ